MYLSADSFHVSSLDRLPVFQSFNSSRFQIRPRIGACILAQTPSSRLRFAHPDVDLVKKRLQLRLPLASDRPHRVKYINLVHLGLLACHQGELECHSDIGGSIQS
jgi:hypothetical protein